MLPPTLLPNLLLATRAALFPANARPASLGLMKTGASGPAPAPQSSVQSPGTGGKTLTAVASPALPIAEGVRVPVAATIAAGSGHADRSNHPSSSSSSSSANGGGIGGGGVDHPPQPTIVSTGATTISSRVDASSEASTGVLSGSENSSGNSDSEIAAIKRRCAANLLAVIPRQVARTLLGVPASSRDRTCSTTTETTPSLTTVAPSPPVSIRDEGGGGHVSRSPSAAAQKTSPPLDSNSSTLSEGRDGPGGKNPAERPRTDAQHDDGADDLEDQVLLRAIETNLLDLLDDAYCNKHLVYAVIESVLTKILPELSEHSVEALMENRGVAPVPGGF